jgi:hypothetical protein
MALMNAENFSLNARVLVSQGLPSIVSASYLVNNEQYIELLFLFCFCHRPVFLGV